MKVTSVICIKVVLDTHLTALARLPHWQWSVQVNTEEKDVEDIERI